MTCSIVVPTYNSGEWIASAIDRIIAVMNSRGADFELVMVNDGSTDDTLSVLNQKAAIDSRIKIISDAKNYGQQRATLTGMVECKGDYIVTIDDDMEYEPGDIPKLYDFAQQNDFDLAYGVPLKIKQNGWRKILYTIYLSALRSSNEKRKTSFRVLKRQIASQLMNYKDSNPINLDFFLDKITKNAGYLNVQYYPSSASRYSAWMYLKLLFNVKYLKHSRWHDQ